MELTEIKKRHGSTRQPKRRMTDAAFYCEDHSHRWPDDTGYSDAWEHTLDERDDCPSVDPEDEMIAKLDRQSASLAQTFQELVDRWREETLFFSFDLQKAMHPDYQKIIGMGRPAIPLILNELKQRPGHWFWALNAITQEDPARGAESFQEAVDAWLTWGRERGYIE